MWLSGGPQWHQLLLEMKSQQEWEQQREDLLSASWAGVGCIILLLSWLLEEQRLFRDYLHGASDYGAGRSVSGPHPSTM